MTEFALLALIFVLFVIWAIAWPHVGLSRQARQIADLEARVATTERALLEALAAAPAPPIEPRAKDSANETPSAATVEEAAPSADGAGETQSETAQEPPAHDWRTNWPGAGARTPDDGAPKSAKPAAARPSIEERLGAKWSVIVGGLALAFGALLLVRYSIEAGLLGPGARVVLGLMLGLALLAGGEWTRRRAAANFGRISIPATLTAAGTVAIFGAIYAAHALYHFIGSPTAFLLLGATGLGAMALASLHGPMLAGVGLIGALTTPALVEARDPAPWPLMLYLIIVVAAAYGLARIKRWFALGVAALAGAALWQILFAVGGAAAFLAPGYAHGLVQTAMAIGVFVAPYIGVQARMRAALSATFAPLLIAAATLLIGLRQPLDGVMSSRVMGALALVSVLAAGGAMTGVSSWLSVAAGAAALAILWVWPNLVDSFDNPAWATPFAPPLETQTFLIFAALAGAVVSAVAFTRLRRFDLAALPCAILGAAGAATPVLLLASAYVRVADFAVSGSFAMAAGALAVAFTLTAASFNAAAQANDDARQTLGFAALGALGALAVGLAAGLNGGSLTAAWGLTALAAAWLSVRLASPALRWGVVAMGALVALRLIWEPRVAPDMSTTLIFNWLLIGYGVPAAAFAGAARLLRRREDVPLQVARGLAIALSGFLVFFEIRHAMNSGVIFARSASLAEVGLQTFSATMFAIVLTRIGGGAPPALYRWATGIAGAIAALLAGVGLLFTENPALMGPPLTHTGFANDLIPGYLLPALGAAALAVTARGMSPRRAQIASVAALALVFLFVTLETRAQFHAFDMRLSRGVAQAESLALSAVWLALGIAALAYGVVRRSREARLGSAVLVTLTTFKVFLFDLSGLEGAWRALSFIGLGLVLIGIGAVYQRLLFPPKARDEADDEADGPAV